MNHYILPVAVQADPSPAANCASTTDKKESEIRLCTFCQSEISTKATICRFCHHSVPVVSEENGDVQRGFTVIKEEVATFEGNITKTFIVIKDNNLKHQVRIYFKNQSNFFEAEPKYEAGELFAVLPQMKINSSGFVVQPGGPKHPLALLIEYLEQEFKEQEEKLTSMVKEGVISYHSLWYLFPKESKFYSWEDDLKVGSTVNSTKYLKGLFPCFLITGDVIKSSGEKIFSKSKSFVIPEFSGLQKIHCLPVRPMDDESLKELTERGKLFNSVAVGSHYFQYKGKILWHQGYFSTAWKADGRVMIDGVSFSRTNPTYDEFKPVPGSHMDYGMPGDANGENDMKAIPQDQLFKAWPTIGGFSFSVKKWGEIIISNVTPIKFDDQAFDKMVLPEDKKSLIKALVLYGDHTVFTDMISGKGAGCIFLLHGSPGVGKTLTAESIAEMLHRPLYSVSVGELGTDPVQLEKKLREILEVASVWNAVILIDEADIFLERRSENDIMRNAMVGIFLRLLEYHQGVLFLTTNRVQNFDEAFHSRINIALKYDELDQESREKVWQNFLEIASLTGLDLKYLSKFELNGRQIRSCIRLALALAKSENTDVNMTHFEKTIRIGSQFTSSLLHGNEKKKSSES